MFCEMCGKNVPKTQKIRIEGSVLQLCDSCSRFGKPVDPVKKPATPVIIETRRPERPSTGYIPRQRKVQRPRGNDLEELFVVPEYASIIREARSKLEWTQEDLASKLLEKKNVLSKIERGELQPDMKLAKRIEKLLDVKILEKE